MYTTRGRAGARRSRRALARTYAHTHGLLICTQTYAYEPTHTHMTVHGDTHLGVARVYTLAWILQVHTNAIML